MKICPVVLTIIPFLCAPLAGAKAGTEFDYTGNNFSYCFNANTNLNSGCYGSKLTGYFITSLTGNALDNLADVFVESTYLSIDTVTDFSFTDGLGLTLTKANTDQAYLQISTDAAGNLTKWNIIVQQKYGAAVYQNDLEILSAPSAVVGTDLSRRCFSSGDYCTGYSEYFESYPQGTWTRRDSDVPEPGAFCLFGGGLLAMSAAAMRRRRPQR